MERTEFNAFATGSRCQSISVTRIETTACSRIFDTTFSIPQLISTNFLESIRDAMPYVNANVRPVQTILDNYLYLGDNIDPRAHESSEFKLQLTVQHLLVARVPIFWKQRSLRIFAGLLYILKYRPDPLAFPFETVYLLLAIHLLNGLVDNCTINSFSQTGKAPWDIRDVAGIGQG